jgi:hypothetical protein
LAKKDDHPKKGSGTDNEETGHTTKDTIEPMDEVEQTTNPVNDVAKPEEPESKVEAEDKMDVDPAEDFVVVEGGGEGDPLAQGKGAVPAEKKEIESAVEEKEEEEGDSAGAQTFVDNVVEPTAAPTTTLPGNTRVNIHTD